MPGRIASVCRGTSDCALRPHFGDALQMRVVGVWLLGNNRITFPSDLDRSSIKTCKHGGARPSPTCPAGCSLPPQEPLPPGEQGSCPCVWCSYHRVCGPKRNFRFQVLGVSLVVTVLAIQVV